MPLNRLKKRTKHHLAGMAVAMALAATAWVLSHYYPPGMLTYIISLPAAIMVLLTALARINDIGPEKSSWIWQMRRIGLALLGAGTFTLAVAPFTDNKVYPTWIGVSLLWGLAATWFASPNLPPWWQYISGELDNTDGN